MSRRGRKRDGSDCPSIASGLPRPWQEGVRVSTYGTVNLANGNLILAVPLLRMGVDGRGPEISFTLYYNSSMVDPVDGGADEGCVSAPPQLGREWREAAEPLGHLPPCASGTGTGISLGHRA